jgi:predicted GNAT family acetyltransferase
MHFASHQQVEHRQQYLQLHRGSTKAWGRTHGIGKELLRGALHIAFSQGWAVGINWTHLNSMSAL